MRQNRERIWRATRVGAVGWTVFEPLEAVSTPLGGGTIAYSLIRTAHLTRATISVTLGAFLNRLVCVQPENASGGLHVWERSGGRSLSVPKHTRYFPMVGHALTHQAVSLGRHRY